MAEVDDPDRARGLRTFARQVLLQHYGIEDAEISTRPGYMSDQAMVEAGGRKWVLKVYGRGLADAQSLSESHRLVHFLANRSYPTPTPVPSARERTVVEHEGKHSALFPFVHGEQFRPGSTAQLSAAGAALGRLHELSRTFEPTKSAGAADLMRRVLDVKGRDLALVRAYLDPLLARRLQQALADSVELLNNVHVLAPWCMMIHGDFRGQNVLFTDDSVAAVLDFDSAAYAPRLVDLAYALVFFQAALAPGPMTREEKAALLTAYESVYPLSEIERELLPPFLRFSWLRGLLLWARIAYLDRASERAEGWIEAYRGGLP